MRGLLGWLALAVVLAEGSAAAADAPRVVVTIKPVHALVAAIMRGAGEPVLLVDGFSSPHTFALRPSGARAVQNADVFIRVAGEVEPFTLRLIETLPGQVQVLTLIDAAGVHTLDRRIGGTFDAHEDGGHHGTDDHDGHAAEHSGRDGHIWLDPHNAKAIVAGVVSALGERDPAHLATYTANAAELTQGIDKLEAEIAATVAPVKSRPFIVFHDAYQYFERRFGLSAAGALTVSPEVPPGAKRLTEIRRRIAGLNAVCVFAEPQLQSKVIASATEGTSAKPGVLDPEGLLLTPGPDLYFTLMRGLAKGFRECLGGSS